MKKKFINMILFNPEFFLRVLFNILVFGFCFLISCNFEFEALTKAQFIEQAAKKRNLVGFNAQNYEYLHNFHKIYQIYQENQTFDKDFYFSNKYLPENYTLENEIFKKDIFNLPNKYYIFPIKNIGNYCGPDAVLIIDGKWYPIQYKTKIGDVEISIEQYEEIKKKYAEYNQIVEVGFLNIDAYRKHKFMDYIQDLSYFLEECDDDFEKKANEMLDMYQKDHTNKKFEIVNSFVNDDYNMRYLPEDTEFRTTVYNNIKSEKE